MSAASGTSAAGGPDPGPSPTAPGAARGAGPVAYLSAIYPLLTETFVQREVRALRALGVDVVTFAGRRPAEGPATEGERALEAETVYALPVGPGRLLASVLGSLLRRPRRTLSTAWFVVSRPGDPPRVRALAAAHFAMALVLLPEVEARGVRHLHAHFSINAATIALVLSRLTGIPFSFTAHNLLFSKPMLLGAKVRAARFVAAISEVTRRALVEAAAPVRVADKVHIVRCGIDPTEFAPPPPRPAREHPEILFVAQLAERKGAHVLVEACALLAARDLEFRCRLVGEGPQRARLEARIAQHGLEGRVELLGARHQPEVRALLADADLFCLPCVVARDGDVDGIPVALMEAMALELPVVSTEVAAVPELVEHGRSGVLAPPEDARALADALAALLADPERRRILGRAGRARILAEFDQRVAAERLAALFDGRRPPTAGR